MLFTSSVNVVKEDLPSKAKKRKRVQEAMTAKVRGTVQACGMWTAL